MDEFTVDDICNLTRATQRGSLKWHLVNDDAAKLPPGALSDDPETAASSGVWSVYLDTELPKWTIRLKRSISKSWRKGQGTSWCFQFGLYGSTTTVCRDRRSGVGLHNSIASDDKDPEQIDATQALFDCVVKVAQPWKDTMLPTEAQCIQSCRETLATLGAAGAQIPRWAV